MLVSEADTPDLKKWVIKRLEDISDADSDVLADYVLALVKSEEPDEQVRLNCLENLEDFLKQHTDVFVNDVFTAIRDRSYTPGYAPPQPLIPTAPAFNPPTGPSDRRSSFQSYPTGPSSGRVEQSRKRTYNDREGSETLEGRDSHYGRGAGGDRSVKQMRRIGTRGQDAYTGRGGLHGALHQQNMHMGGMSGLGQPQQFSAPPVMPQMPTPPPGLPAFDPTNPLAAIMAMQAMGFPPLPGMPPLPFAGFPIGFGPSGSPTNFSQNGPNSAAGVERAGRFAAGESEEYDPNNASLLDLPLSDRPNGHTSSENYRGGDRGRGRGRGRGDRGAFRGGRGGRAEFSFSGPNFDREVTTVVVEQIPEDKFNEESVREFFSEFGNIVGVTMQAYKRLALVKYDDWASARRAYDSPKVIFDNRFVKVYWYRPDTVPKPPENGAARAATPTKARPDIEMEEDPIDPVEFAKKQEEAQKAHEEKLQKLKEASTKREELERLMKAQAEERRKLQEKLAAKTASKARSPPLGAPKPANGAANGAATEGKVSQTEALRAKLAELEAEAQSIGIDPEEAWTGFPTRGRGRGGYRGRGGFPPRGRGFDPSRGSFRGRGAFPRGGSVKKLDNRPKKVAVVFPGGEEFEASKDEALRQYLLFSNLESDTIDPHPDRKDAAVVAFTERYMAETFIASAKDIPHIGKVELSWVTTPLPLITPAPVQQGDGDVAMGDGSNVAGEKGLDVDYDVADDEDRWMRVS
ncbi:CCCH zinc finger and RRM domain-containing protein [Cryomyces antarcticus]